MTDDRGLDAALGRVMTADEQHADGVARIVRRFDSPLPPQKRAPGREGQAQEHARERARERPVEVAREPGVERLVDAVSKVEPNASLTAAVEKAGTWFQKLRSAAKT